MNNPTLLLMLQTATRLTHPLPEFLASALDLAKSHRCPPAHLAAIRKAATDAHNLWLHLGNVVTLFELDAEPPRD